MFKDGIESDSIKAKIDSFEKQQSALIKALKLNLPTENTENLAEILDTSKAAEVLTLLKKLLDFDDGKSANVFEENSALLQFVLGSDVFTKVDKAIKQFDFQKALQYLDTVNLAK